MGDAWANHLFLGIPMANSIAEYDAKIYFWGMVLFASVCFIALPVTAFIYLDNKILREEIKQDRKETKQLKQKLEEQLKNEKTINNPDTSSSSGV